VVVRAFEWYKEHLIRNGLEVKVIVNTTEEAPSELKIFDVFDVDNYVEMYPNNPEIVDLVVKEIVEKDPKQQYDEVNLKLQS
jgi:hypothetical protein